MHPTSLHQGSSTDSAARSHTSLRHREEGGRWRWPGLVATLLLLPTLVVACNDEQDDPLNGEPPPGDTSVGETGQDSGDADTGTDDSDHEDDDSAADTDASSDTDEEAEGPQALIVFSTVEEGETTNASRIEFSFASSPAGADSFECSIGGAPFEPCEAEFVVDGLLAGGYSLRVRASEDGVVGPVTSRDWVVAPAATTIREIQEGLHPEHTLVRVSTDVRLTGMPALDGTTYVFIQEAWQSSGLPVDEAGDEGAALRAGILTVPLEPQTSRSVGTNVTVTGIYRHIDGNRQLVSSTYAWGSDVAPREALNVRSASVLDDRLHGVHIRLAAELPAFNCSSLCNNGAWFGNSQPCLRPCFASECTSVGLVEWVQSDALVDNPVTDWGSFEGFLVGRGSDSYLLITDDSPASDDVCL